ncbi:tryptophan synthase subunit alpha [Shigella flexneri]
MKIIDTPIEAGADALELAFRSPDPLADGPTIQEATWRAFAAASHHRNASRCWPDLPEYSDDSHWGVAICQPAFSKGIDEFSGRVRKSGCGFCVGSRCPC